MKTYFKVIYRAGNNNMFSAIVNGTRDFSTRYSTSKWSSARIGGLLVFNTLKAAKKMVKNERMRAPRLEIWTCKCKHPMSLPKLRLYESEIFVLKYLKQVWKHKLMLEKSSTLIKPWPAGSRAFKQVKLIERVD